MSGGGKTQTSTSTVQIPQEVLARYNAVNTRAEGVAETPFQAYSYDPSAFVAPMTETQNQAISQIGQASGMAQPYFQTGAAATLGGMGPANLGELDTSKYMSPYLQNVVQNTADILGQQNRQDMSGALGTAIQSGAGFGDRSGIAAANLNRQQMMGMGSTIGNLLNQGYQQAQGVAQQQQSADLAARQANLARLLQGGQSIGQLGAGAQGAALAGSQALLGAGTQQQQTEQAGKSALYNQYQQERAYPFQVAQFLGNIAMGTGALSGNTTTETRPAGFFSGLKRGGRVDGASYRRGGLVPESMGGHVNAGHMGEGYADGGAPQMDYATMVMQQLFGGMNPGAGVYGQGNTGIGMSGFVPQANLPVGQLNPAKISESAPQTSISDLVDTGEKLYEGAKEVKGWFGEEEPPVIDKNDPKFKNWDRAASGGAVRPGLAAGGMPYDPQNTGYVPDNTPKANPELTPAKISGGQESGLDKIADIAKIVGTFMPMRHGGVAGRHGYAGGGYPEDAESLMAFARRKARDTAESSYDPGQQNLPPDIKGASYDPGRQNLPPEIVTVPTAEDSFRRNLETAAPAGAAVEQPAGLSAADANRIRQQFYTDYYAKQPVSQIKNDERLAPGLTPPAAGNVLGKNVSFDRFGGEPIMPSYKDTLLGGVSPAAAQMDLTAPKAPSPYGFEGYAGEGLGRNGINPIGPRQDNRTEFERLATAAAPLFQSHLGPLKDALSQRGVVWKDNYDPIRDFFGTRPDEAEAVKAKRAYGQEIVDFYKDLGPYFEANPAEYERALAEPVKYFEDRAGLIATNPKADLAPGAAPGLVPSSGSLLGEAKFDMFGAPPAALAGAALPPAAKTPYAPGVFLPGMVPPIPRARADRPAALADAALPATAEKVAAAAVPAVGSDVDATGVVPGLVAPTPRDREDRPNIAPTEKRALVPTAAGTAELGPTIEKYKGDDFFGEHIIPRESAGRQFDKYGNPLTSSAGAIGISQMLPSTGPEAAALAGVQWDENRFYNDPAYNEKLGRAYFDSLLKRYNGDTTLASAAYNAGMGNVDKAIARARSNGGSWTDYLPGETQKYISGMPGGTADPGSYTDTRPDGGRDDQPAPGLGGKNLWEQMVEKAGSPENIILPFLSGLGKMAGSQSRFLGTAILEGIGGGAEAYMNRQKQLADIAQTQSLTRGSDIQNVANSVKDIGGVNYVVTANGGLQQFNDWLSNPSAPIAGGEALNNVLRLAGQQLAAQNGTANTGNVSSVLQTVQTAPRAVEGGAGMPVSPSQPPVPTNVPWDPRASEATDRADKMISEPGAADLIKNSVALLDAVTAGGATAGDNRLNIAEQAMAVSALMGAPPLESFGAQGSGRAAITKALNLASQSLGLGTFSDMPTQTDILDKLRFAQANNLVNASNQDSYNALSAAASMMPNIEQDPIAAATIMATLMVDNQRAIDRSSFYNAFADQTTSKILRPAGAEFNRMYDNVYKQEVAYLRDLMSNPQAAPYIQGAMKTSTPEEAQRILSNAFGGKQIPPKLYRYFVAGGAI